MKALWWFKERSIAGMARPGFNLQHWFDLPFDEAIVLGWFGQRSSGSEPLDSIRTYMRDYGARVRTFHNIDGQSFDSILRTFKEAGSIHKIVEKVVKKTNCLEHFEISNQQITFKLSHEQLKLEIDFLKAHNITTLVALTEEHHQKMDLEPHFEMHHIAIPDLNAPRLEQVQNLATLIQRHLNENRAMAIHCMAGIGRTSTMLAAAHLLLGHNLSALKTHLAVQNPQFKWTVAQEEFIYGMVNRGARQG